MKNPLTSNLEQVILEMCAKRFDLTVEDYINKKSNHTENVLRRYYSYYLIRKNTHLTYDAIGAIFSVDQCQIRYGMSKIEDYLSYDKRVITEIKNLQQMIDNFTTEKENSFLNLWLTQQSSTRL